MVAALHDEDDDDEDTDDGANSQETASIAADDASTVPVVTAAVAVSPAAAATGYNGPFTQMQTGYSDGVTPSQFISPDQLVHGRGTPQQLRQHYTSQQLAPGYDGRFTPPQQLIHGYSPLPYIQTGAGGNYQDEISFLRGQVSLLKAANDDLMEKNSRLSAENCYHRERQQVRRKLKYKSEICTHFSSGNCWYGKNCNRAHGDAELQQYKN